MAIKKLGKERVFILVPSFDFAIGRVPLNALITNTLEDIKNRLASTIRELVPVDTGELQATGIGEFGPTRISPNRWRAGVGLKKDPHYGIFVHDGTGIYGPRKSPITPRKAPYLKFTIGERTFRLRSVKGQEPQPFVDEAFYIINRTYVPFKVSRLRSLIQAFGR